MRSHKKWYARTYKKWYAKNGALYRPDLTMKFFLQLWFLVTFFGTSILLQNSSQFWVFLAILFLSVIAFLVELKRSGWTGKPIIIINNEKIIFDEKSIHRSNNSPIEIEIYADDQIHIVGPKGRRFIRLISKSHPNREIRPIFNQRLIKYITKQLRKKHRIVSEDYPGVIATIRNDF